MHAKITIEWDSGLTFTAEHVVLRPSDVDLREADYVRRIVGEREIVATQSIELEFRGTVHPADGSDELYRWEQKPKEGP